MKGFLRDQLGVIVRAAIVTAAGYGSLWVVTGAPFSVFWFGIVVGVLTIATNAVFWYARDKRRDVLAMAQHVTDRVEGRG